MIAAILLAAATLATKPVDIPPANCGLDSYGVLWSANTDKFTMFVTNSAKTDAYVGSVKFFIQSKPDTGDIPDPKNVSELVIQLPHRVRVKGLSALGVEFDAPTVNPESVVDSQPLCAGPISA